jgi:tetratricopeptide (TPR) repeat protein
MPSAARSVSGSGQAGELEATELLELAAELHESGELDEAEAAYLKAIASSQTDVAACACADLGLLYCERCDVDSAEEAFLRALGSDHPDACAYALAGLGVVADARGDAERACEEFLAAIATRHPVAAPFAKAHLEQLRSR